MSRLVRVSALIFLVAVSLHNTLIRNAAAQDDAGKDKAAKKEKKEVVEKALWQNKAEESLIGIWELESTKQDVIPKLKISLDDDDRLQIQFWGRGATDNDPSEDADLLHVLSRYRGAGVEGESAVAFASREAAYGVMHFTLKLNDDLLSMDGVKIVKDPTKKVNRIVSAAYVPEGTAKDGKDEEEDPADKDSKDSEAEKMEAEEDADDEESGKPEANESDDSNTKPTPPAKPGSITGKIESGSTLRGRITLSPMPPKATPAAGIEVEGSNPRFQFGNVPEGEYTVIFQGTINGTTQTLRWSGQEIVETPLSLSVRSAQ